MSFHTLLPRAVAVRDTKKLEDYYEGKAQLDTLGLALPPEVRLLERTAQFPRLAVDSLSEVLVPEGYILGDDTKTPEALSKVWQANDMDSASHLAINEALVQGDAYWIVGRRPNGKPRITAHPSRGAAVSLDPFGGVAEGLVVWSRGGVRQASHYLPGVTVPYTYDTRVGDWVKGKEIPTGLSEPAIVQMANRERLGDSRGRSEILRVLNATKAAGRTLTAMQLAQELLALPQRYLFADGLDAAKLGKSPFEAYINSFITGPAESKIGQLAGADLTSFHNTYKLYAGEIAGATGIPLSMLGISTDNPTSAEAMRVAYNRLYTRAEVRQRHFGDAFETVGRLILELLGETPDNADELEMRWRDPASVSEDAHRAIILQAHAQGVVSAETARESLRLTPQQLARERERDSLASPSIYGA